MSTESQTARVLRHLQTGRGLSSLSALDRFGIFRLAARVHSLRKCGHKIETRMIKVGEKRFARYVLS